MHKIMIVDDEKDLVAGLEMNLVREGFEVIKAFDGESALRQTTSDLAESLWFPSLGLHDRAG